MARASRQPPRARTTAPPSSRRAGSSAAAESRGMLSPSRARRTLARLRAPRLAVALLVAAPGAVGAGQPVATFVVTTVADSGPGSLRQAILDANASPGLDRVTFAIAAEPKDILLNSPLPSITDPI